MALPSSSAYGSLRSTCFPVGFFESPTFYSWILGRLGAQKVWMSTCSWASCLGLRKNYSYTNCRANDLACMRQLVQTCPWSKHTTALGKCMNTPTCPWCVHSGFLPRWHVLSDNLTDTHIMLLQMCKTSVSVPLDIWPLVLHQSLLLSLSPSCPPEDRSRVSCHSAIWMPNTWKRLATWPKLRQQTHSKSQRERWKMLKTLKGSCWCPFYIFFQRISPKKKHGEHVPICSNSGHLPGFVATNFSCTSLLVGFAAIIGPAPKRFDTAFWGLTWTGSRPNAPSSRPHSTSNSMGLLLDSHGDGHLRSVRPLKISRVFVFSTCIVL